eukprot:jgi/Mesvir1/9025/Mv21309-RA.2
MIAPQKVACTHPDSVAFAHPSLAPSPQRAAHTCPQVGLFAPGEQCSAAAALGMLYYFILAHQADFDVKWCRGTVGAQIFAPWVRRITQMGGNFRTERRVTGVQVDPDTGAATGVLCGDEVFPADAVVFAVGIRGMQNIVRGCEALSTRDEFVNTSNLKGVDILAVRLWLDKKIKFRQPSNACFGFDDSTGWTFFDLNALHDEYRDREGTVVEVDFYHANQLLPLSDDAIQRKVMSYLSRCVPAFATATVQERAIVRFPGAVTHFFPGAYSSLMKPTTSFPNVFMSGDWIMNTHGSWSQEKAYVTGLEAANRVVTLLRQGEHANVIPVEDDEPHIKQLRDLNLRLTRGKGLPIGPSW